VPKTATADRVDRTALLDFLVSTYPQRAEVTNARRDPAVSLCVLSADWNDPWRTDPRAPHRSHARGGPLQEGRKLGADRQQGFPPR
jgi:hypothetical protein